MAYTGQETDCTGASVKIDGTELARGGTTEVSIKEQIEEKTIQNYGNYPDEKTTKVKTWCEGSVKWTCDKAADFPHPSGGFPTLLITSDGMKFNGASKITDLEVKLGTGDMLEGSFNFKSKPNYGATTNYTFNNNPS